MTQAPEPTPNPSPLPAAGIGAGADTGWQALPAAAARLAAIGGGILGLPLGAALALVYGVLLRPGAAAIAAGGAVLVLAGAVATAWLAHLRCRRTRWRLDAHGLQVRRGLFWRNERLVPRSRVQHLDIERGPFERSVGLATLVVHTAGTRVHALRQAGLRDADAVALRDALLPAEGRDDDVL